MRTADGPTEGESASPVDTREALLHLAEEAVELERRGLAILDGVRANGRLAVLAPEGSSIAARFIEMRYQLPSPVDPQQRHCADLLDAIFNHHTWLLHLSLDLLAMSWMYERLEEQRLKVNGFGMTTEWLAVIVDALRSDRLELLDPLPYVERSPRSE